MVGPGIYSRQLWKPGGPWSEGEMGDPSEVAFALHLGFTSWLPKVGSIEVGSIEPLARAALRQREEVVLPSLHQGLLSLSSSFIFWDTVDIWQDPGQSSMVMVHGQHSGKGPFPFLTLAGI